MSHPQAAKHHCLRDFGRDTGETNPEVLMRIRFNDFAKLNSFSLMCLIRYGGELGIRTKVDKQLEIRVRDMVSRAREMTSPSLHFEHSLGRVAIECVKLRDDDPYIAIYWVVRFLNDYRQNPLPLSTKSKK